MDMPWQMKPVVVAFMVIDRPVDNGGGYSHHHRAEKGIVSPEGDECIGSSWVDKNPKPIVVPPPPPPPPPVVVAPPPPPPPVVVAPPPPPVVKPKPILAPVLFDVIKSYINPMGAKVLDNNGKILRENPNMKVEIGGHTDSTGSEAANKVISEKRANSCKKYLMDKFSIAGDRLTTKGYGSSKPIADNKTAEGREKNRRVEFKILSY